MDDTDATLPAPDTPPSNEPRTPAPVPAKPGYAILDGTVLLALLGTCAGVYYTVGNIGFSAIVGAAAGLYGTWRNRR
ncbi:hypothetical protein [Streptomyces sp. NPDC051452]|uniref:hypothetical protein n=1 Tax=Streptomyces sp. NPDC051452 TaxID=3365654 RepID=UPI0037B75222